MHDFWGLVASNAVIATALAVGTMPLGRVWKDAAAIHGLWLVVLLKLFTPPLVTAGLPIAFPSSIPADGPAEKAPISPAGREAGPTTPDGIRNSRIAGGSGGRQDTPGGGTGATADREPWSLSALLAATWLGGACVVGVARAVRIRRFARVVGDSEAAPPAIRLEVAQLSRRLGLGRVPEVLMTPRALPPLVWSMGISPRVILPSRLFDRLGGEAQGTILAHELAHIRRGDHLVRLLELAATTVFWWHPVAWLAGRRLRELEEQCCDGRVLELLPGRPRAYAAALVDTLEFLSGGACPPVPLGTAIDSTTSLSRRIHMLTQRRTSRLSASSLTLVVGLAAFPLAVAFAAVPRQAAKAAPEVRRQPADAPAPVLRGRVTTKAGAPLPGARVRVAIPAADMRFVDPSTDHTRLEAKSDANGDYQIQFPGVAKPTKVSIDAMMPGFRRLVGTLMRGGDARMVDVEPGATAEANLVLEPARYFSGIVVDEQGRPIASARVGANFVFDRGSGGVERTATGPDGWFELFNYPVDLRAFGDREGKGLIFFAHPDYIDSTVDDIDAIEPDQRGDLRIVLPTGRKIAGKVLDAAGKPVRNAMVEAVIQAEGQRKATLTDANGGFAMRGLKDGPATLTARVLEIKQKGSLAIALDGDKAGLEVRLQPIALPADLKKYAVFGMQLADVTPELKAAYDLYWDRGALILDPGPDSDRLKIGDLAEGYLFWMVGQIRIGSVREFVDQVLVEAGDRDAEEYRVRVVYSFRTPEAVGNNTQHLKLTKDDIKQLKAVSDRLKAQSK